MTAPLSNIVITALGAITPVGATAEKSVAMIAAGIKQFNEHAYYNCTPSDPDEDEIFPLFAADLPILDPFLDGRNRLLQIALPALTEVMNNGKLTRRDLEQCGLMLSLPQADKAISIMNLSTRFVPALRKLSTLSTFKLSKTAQTGHTGVFSLLRSAIQKLQAGNLAYCMVGGVDSYLLKERLEMLDAAWRLRSARTVDGFIPGEAAAMFLLETEQNAKARGMPILAYLGELGEGNEVEAFHSKRNSTGDGLTQAIESVIQTNAPPMGFETVYCSLNGESYYAFEWGVVLARLNETLQKMKALINPADSVGDVGAACGALLVACATIALKKSKTVGAQSLLWTSSDNGHRMALTLRKVEG